MVIITLVSNSGIIKASVMPPVTNPFCKTWNLTGEIVTGVEQAPEAIMAGDKLIINEDLTITVTFNGVETDGTYVLVGDNTWLSISLNDGSSLRLKVLNITETTLQVEHINAESVHRIFVFTAL